MNGTPLATWSPGTVRRLAAGTWIRLAASVVMLGLTAPVGAQAFELQGEKALIAQTRDGTSTRIGSVFFEPASQAGRTAFRVKMDHAALRDYFLSMREFKCLPAEAEVSCYVPYPYAQPGTIAPNDLGWLEHSLLFLYKQPRDFGAKLWNGMIFKLSPTPEGFVGSPQAVDLNRISAPPDDLSVPPYGPFDRDDFPPGARWVTSVRIE
jgi:hypothetical protein